MARNSSCRKALDDIRLERKAVLPYMIWGVRDSVYDLGESRALSSGVKDTMEADSKGEDPGSVVVHSIVTTSHERLFTPTTAPALIERMPVTHHY